MKANPYISIKEKRLLTILASIVFVLNILNLGLIEIKNLQNTGIDFCVYCRLGYIPLFRLFSIFVFPFVLWSRKFYLSTTISVLSFLTFCYEFYLNVRANIENDNLFSNKELINIIASPLDYLVFLLISILLFWQISILLRILITNRQRKIGLS